jgi:hypothetical protein
MTPTGKDLLSILVNLLADQEGVTIKYEYIQKNKKGE